MNIFWNTNTKHFANKQSPKNEYKFKQTCFRYGARPVELCKQAAAEEEEKVTNRLYQPPGD